MKSQGPDIAKQALDVRPSLPQFCLAEWLSMGWEQL